MSNSIFLLVQTIVLGFLVFVVYFHVVASKVRYYIFFFYILDRSEAVNNIFRKCFLILQMTEHLY